VSLEGGGALAVELSSSPVLSVVAAGGVELPPPASEDPPADDGPISVAGPIVVEGASELVAESPAAEASPGAAESPPAGGSLAVEDPLAAGPSSGADESSVVEGTTPLDGPGDPADGANAGGGNEAAAGALAEAVDEVSGDVVVPLAVRIGSVAPAGVGPRPT